jgi:hypothetical protein
MKRINLERLIIYYINIHEPLTMNNCIYLCLLFLVTEYYLLTCFITLCNNQQHTWLDGSSQSANDTATITVA